MHFKRRVPTKSTVVIFSTVLAILAASVLYETYKEYKYQSWKKYYAEKGNWYEKLTIASSNPLLMWEYRPNTVYHDRKRLYTITTNRYGFRGRDKDLSVKLRSTKRVAFLGDSSTLGLFVDQEDTFVSKFERYANQNASNAPVEALNCSVDGYHALQILELLKTKVLNLLPDTVVYVMHLNDFDFEFSSSQKSLYFKKPDSFLLNDIRNVIWPLFYDYYDYSFERNKESVFLAVNEMSKLLRDRNIDFAVVVLPVFLMEEESFASYPHWKLHESIDRFLLDEGIKTMDLARIFKKENQRPKTLARDVWHLNPAGHDSVARLMVRFLLK